MNIRSHRGNRISSAASWSRLQLPSLPLLQQCCRQRHRTQSPTCGCGYQRAAYWEVYAAAVVRAGVVHSIQHTRAHTHTHQDSCGTPQRRRTQHGHFEIYSPSIIGLNTQFRVGETWLPPTLVSVSLLSARFFWALEVSLDLPNLSRKIIWTVAASLIVPYLVQLIFRIVGPNILEIKIRRFSAKNAQKKSTPNVLRLSTYPRVSYR